MPRIMSGLLAVCAAFLALPGTAQELKRLENVPTELFDAVGVQPATQKSARRMYVVQLAGEPGISYEGGVDGFAATAPENGARYNAKASHVQQYTSHLVSKHDEKLAAVGALGHKTYSYRHTMNGFAAMLTPAEVTQLRADKSVTNIFEDFSMDIDTNNSPDFLGLNDRREGLRKRLRLKGEDVIVGVLDTGAIQEHPSFSDTRTFDLPAFCDAPQYRFQERICAKLERFKNQVVYDAPPAHWQGECEAGEAWSADDCNNKLIGARWYVDGFIAGRGSVVEGEFLSPRDSSGHGSHTASTAAGNHVTASLNGVKLARISGMAPRARIAAYKVCWLSPGATNFSCFFSDSAAATDQAVEDGVDVLNFSVGTAASFVDTQDLAFLRASNAGVFVARSAGNDGPDAGSTNAGEPWVTSVAASTLTGTGYALVVSVFSPPSVAGDYPFTEANFTLPLSVGGPVSGMLALVDDGDTTLGSTFDACEPLVNGADVAGNIALITRGGCSFQTKLDNAAAAGASAAIVFNNQPGRITMAGTTDPGISAVMIDNEPGLALVDALNAGEVVNVAFSATNFVTEELEGNIMAGFSSRGPYLTESDWVKPDITAPGVRILAAYSPDQADGSQGDIFSYLQGTSMSSPHIAGLGALVKQAHPDWSPAQIKSALMTTARQNVVKEDGVTPADPFDFGAGHVDPNGSVDPGLTYDAGLLDYLAASCGTVTPLVSDDDCDFVENGLGLSTSAADLNLPSIGIGALPGSQTVTRTVTAVRGFKGPHGYYGSNRPKHYHAVVESPEGFDVQVSPSSLYLRNGETASYEVTITNQTAPVEEWRFGSLTWVSDKERNVRSPIAVRAVKVETVEEVDGGVDAGGNGSVAIPIKFGYDGAYSAAVSGLEQSFAGGGNSSAANTPIAFCVDLPAMDHFRASMFDADTSVPGSDDLDLRLFLAQTDCATFDLLFLGSSGGVTSEEVIDIPNAPAGGYVVVVDYFAAANGTDSDFLVWYQPVLGDNGNTTVTAPATAVTGAEDVVTVDYSGLATGRHLGVLKHADGSGEIARTLIDIDAQ